MDYKQPPPALTLQDFYALPDMTRLEVYVAGPGLWVPARVVHSDLCSCVTPESDGLAVLHEVIILDEMPDACKEAKLLLVRRPHPRGRMLEPGDYRDAIERFARDLVRLMRRATTSAGDSSATRPKVRGTLRHLLSAGGLTGDLWHVIDAVLKDEFKPQEDDGLLMRILADIKEG